MEEVTQEINEETGLMTQEDADREKVTQEVSIRVQRAKWVEEETRKKRDMEDEVRQKLLKEQEMIDEIGKSIDANMEMTRQARRYNEELQEDIHERVFALHGLSEDKLVGMKEYKNAYYKGVASGMFFLSVVMVVLCALLHGVTAQITLFMGFFTAVEGTLLTAKKSRKTLADGICRLLYLLLFPAMLVIFVCYELSMDAYAYILPYVVIAGALILLFGAVPYFIDTPYRDEKRRAGEAKDSLKEMEKLATKEIKKSQKKIQREIKKQEKKEKKVAK